MSWVYIVAFVGVFIAVLLSILAFITAPMQIHSWIDTYIKTYFKRSPVKLTLIVMIVAIVVSVILTPTVMQISKMGEDKKDASGNAASSFTQSGQVYLSPNSSIYNYTIYSWSRPAYGDQRYCLPELPTCDPASVRVDLLREETIVTATCWTHGQRVITGNKNNPGYDDNRWARLEDGTYLANTWFARQNLNTAQLPSC